MFLTSCEFQISGSNAAPRSSSAQRLTKVRSELCPSLSTSAHHSIHAQTIVTTMFECGQFPRGNLQPLSPQTRKWNQQDLQLSACRDNIKFWGHC